VFVSKTSDKKHMLRIFSRYGEEVKDSNDALIITARYLFDKGDFPAGKIELNTPYESRTVETIDSTTFLLSLGKPGSAPGGEEIKYNPDKEYTEYVTVEKKEYIYTPVFLNRFGIVLLNPPMEENKLKRLSTKIATQSVFSQIPQPVFYQVFTAESINVSMWPSGKQLPDYLSSCAIAGVASTLNGFTDKEVFVSCNGFEFFVKWLPSTNHIVISGYAEYVFSGFYYFEDFH